MSVGVVLWGAAGRMGRSIEAEVLRAEGVTLVSEVGEGDAPAPRGDVVIDFSTPRGCSDALEFARAIGAGFVSGTTGLDEGHEDAFRRAAEEIPVLVAANMSLGVAVTKALVRTAAEALPLSYSPEIVEVHHRHKVAAPSGTAIALGDEVRAVRGVRLRTMGRQGYVGPRPEDELAIHALRGGDVVGEHTVSFFGEGERVEITHRAGDRAIFARGAVAAAMWIHERPPGRYLMEHVLGLR